MKKYIRPTLLALLVALVLFQFYRPARNLSGDDSRHLSTKYPLPADVEAVLKPACYPCHSNLTEYPWYANVQPVASWLSGHVNEGKRELNYSTFANLRVAVANKKFEETVKMVEEKEMPIGSFTWFGLHPEAKLDEAQRKLLVDWARAQSDTLKARYPADSLVLRRKPR